MINLTLPKESESTKLTEIKRLVFMVTAVVSIAYAVGTAGYIGWQWYWFQKSGLVAKDLNLSLDKLKSYSSMEAAINQTAARAQAVEKYLNERELSGEYLKLMQADKIKLAKWTYDDSGKQQATITASDSTEAHAWVEKIKLSFEDVSIEKAGWNEEDKWEVTVNLGKAKKS